MDKIDDPGSSSSLQPTKRYEQTVYVFNLSEDVWPFISAITDDKARKFEIEENANLADHGLFALAETNDSIFISPKPIDPAFVRYYQELFGIKQLTTLYPKEHSGLLSLDIIEDETLFNQLVAAGQQVKRLRLMAYSTSLQFLKLAAALRAAGVEVYTPEAPEEEDAWTVNFFGSKGGIRQLAQWSSAKEPDLRMADGMVCMGIEDAAKIAAKKYLKENGVVLKTNKGHSGAGVLIFRENELPSTYKQCEQAILAKLREDDYWEKFPIIVESLINVNYAVGGGFPNVEFKIRKSGEVELLYFCGMRVNKNGVFQGVVINEDAVNDRIEARITDTGFFIGEQYAAAGYRGFFDVDFIAAKNGEMYVTESNVRRTGGTHVYEAAVALIGKEFMIESYTLSRSVFPLPNVKPVTFEELLAVLKPVLYDAKKKEGVVLANANILNQSQIEYMVFGPNEKRSLAIEEQMHQLLHQL